MSLSAFPTRIAIGVFTGPDGKSYNVYQSPEFARALADVLSALGNGEGLDSASLTLLASFATTIAGNTPDAATTSADTLSIGLAADIGALRQELTGALVQLGQAAAVVSGIERRLEGLELQTPFAVGSGLDWERPGRIGAQTPNTGVFTTVNKLTFTQPAASATFTLSNGKTFTISNTLTLTATDGSTLAIGGGGTLGTAAYTAASAYALVAGSTSQAFSTSTLAASDAVTATKNSAGATVEVLSLKNSGGGVSTKAAIGFYAAGTKYAAINGGYGAAAPEITVDVSGTQELKLASTGLAVNAGFGCNTKTAQAAYALGAAATDLPTVLTLANNLRNLCIGNGTGS